MESIEHLIGRFRSEVVRTRQDCSKVEELRRKMCGLGDTAIDGLSGLLHDRKMQVREAVIDVLEEIGSERAMDAIVSYGLNHLRDPNSSSKIPGPGWARLRTAGKKVLPALARAYKKTLPFKTRLSMIHIAHQIGGPAAWPLLEVALEETDQRLAQAAAEALGRVGGDVAYMRLVQLLHANSVQRRFGAIQGLQLLGNPAAIEPLLSLLLGQDYPIHQWWPSGQSDSLSLHSTTARAIDTLAGERLDGDIDRIRRWLEKHKHILNRTPGK